MWHFEDLQAQHGAMVSEVEKDSNLEMLKVLNNRDIAEKKMEDLNAHDLDEAAKIIAGSAKSMGIEVKD